MKKITLPILFFMLVFTGAPWLIGKTGCMSKSQHLKEKFDNKYLIRRGVIPPGEVPLILLPPT